jgi:hypothetical protein
MDFHNYKTSPTLDHYVIPFELTSTHRDRTQYPNPCQFETPSNNAGQTNNAFMAVDPVSDQLPINVGSVRPDPKQLILQWTGIDINLIGTIVSINTDELVVNITSPSPPITDFNFYRGILAQFASGNSKVISYRYIGSNIGVFSVKLPNSLPSIGSSFTIDFNASGINTTTSSGIVFVPNTMNYMEIAGNFLFNETQDEFRKIFSYNSESSEAVFSNGPVPTWTNTDVFSIRKQIPFITNIGATPPPTINTVSVNSIVGSPGWFIRNSISGEIRKIIGINNNQITFDPSVSLVWSIGQRVELVTFSNDNFAFITFSNMQRELSTHEYEIILNSLTFPRQLLSSGIYVDALSHIYLEVTDINNSVNNNFMSNNSGSRRALFKATTDRTQLKELPFIKFISDNALMTMKFRPSGSVFRFAILDPNGKVLNFVNTDSMSPYPPNPLLQCSILLSIQKR